MKIAIFARSIDTKWHIRLSLVVAALLEREAELTFFAPFYKKAKQEYMLNLPVAETFSSHEDLPKDIDIFLCLGGDGTFLESLTLIQDRNLPVAGVNFGRLGFLTSADSAPSNRWIDMLFKGDYKIEKRTVLKVSSADKFNCMYPFALNEVSVQRQDPSMLSVTLKINGMELPTYWSDGIVIATPTGSTAYSMSIGGPIMFPTAKALIIAPIAPHNLNIRPLVVPDDTVIELVVTARKTGAILCLDNRTINVSSGDKFTISKAGFYMNYISLPASGFIGALKEKLLWGEDRRNS